VIDEDVDLDGLPLSVQASLGYVLAGEDGNDLDTLLQRADVAMYAAKARHAGVLRYDSAFDNYDAAQLSLIGELRHAISPSRSSRTGASHRSKLWFAGSTRSTGCCTPTSSCHWPSRPTSSTS